MNWIKKHINISYGVAVGLAFLNEWLSMEFDYWTIGWITMFVVSVMGGVYVLVVKKRLLTWWVFPIMMMLPMSLFPIVCLLIKQEKPMEAGIYNVSFKTRTLF